MPLLRADALMQLQSLGDGMGLELDPEADDLICHTTFRARCRLFHFISD